MYGNRRYFSEIQKEAYQYAHRGRVESYTKIISWIPKGVLNILDIGAGYGIFQEMLRVAKCVSIDLYPKKKGVIKADMHNLPFKDNVFDCIFFSHSLEHSHIPVVALSEANRVLTTEGFVLLILPAYIDKPQLEHISHWSVFPTDTWLGIFKRLGFKNLRNEQNSYFWEQADGNRIWRDEEFYLFQKERDIK